MSIKRQTFYVLLDLDLEKLIYDHEVAVLSTHIVTSIEMGEIDQLDLDLQSSSMEIDTQQVIARGDRREKYVG